MVNLFEFNRKIFLYILVMRFYLSHLYSFGMDRREKLADINILWVTLDRSNWSKDAA